LANVETLQIASLSKLIGWIEERFSGESTLYFRGQGRDYPLQPSIARLNPKRRNMTLLDTEQKLFRAFQRQSLPFLEMKPETAWDWLAVAKHYGLPTRLLDWSVNALSAVWFAVEKPAQQDVSGRTGHAVVWVLEAREGLIEKGGDYISSGNTSSPFGIARTGILVPRYISKRIVAQGGYFTIHPSSRNEPHFQALDLEESFKDRLLKIEISDYSFPGIRDGLTRMGVNAMTIYPDLVGLCQDIKWRYALADDEIVGEAK
jgi:FRG domain